MDELMVPTRTVCAESNGEKIKDKARTRPTALRIGIISKSPGLKLNIFSHRVLRDHRG
jgi:hypothetical protein